MGVVRGGSWTLTNTKKCLTVFSSEHKVVLDVGKISNKLSNRMLRCRYLCIFSCLDPTLQYGLEVVIIIVVFEIFRKSFFSSIV